jgi:tRNA 5-methylaminomethyl-2-thiouridine biosynthesis bifunctional protein
MAEPVEWLADGTPRSPRFGDIYRSASGGLEQARQVFLRGCGLPKAWADRPQWRILETGFGLGLNFLATWQAWKDDARRPRLLHFVSVEAWPVDAGDLDRSVEAYPELQPLAQALAAQWYGLSPGAHRLAFEDGRVLLTLHVRDVQDALRHEAFDADSVFLDGFDPLCNPAMWDAATLKAVARHCHRGTTLATWTAAGEVRRDLVQCGFAVEKMDGLPPKRHSLKAVFDPAWEPKGQRVAQSAAAGNCIVVGGGLSGAAAAASLARRGWNVTVIDAAQAPAAGASGLPAGLLVPHRSTDDNLLSRLSRAGVRITLQQARELLEEDADWRAGVREQRPETPALWHEHAAWIRPASLVKAWLAQPGIAWQGNVRVERITRDGEDWRLFDAHGSELARAPLVVVAAALGAAALLEDRLALQPVRGQISWGFAPPGSSLPSFAVNGNGHFIPGVPQENGLAWYCGSSFGRGDIDLRPRAEDHVANLERLRTLAPEVAGQLAPAFAVGEVNAWVGVRCTSSDRRPLVGEMAPGLWVSTAMGSRGLTFCVLAAELMAARLHGEPWPLEQRLGAALDVRRVPGSPEFPPSRE